MFVVVIIHQFIHLFVHDSCLVESLLKNAPCIRAMVTDSDILDQGMLFIVTINGGMVGREPRADLVIPIPDINVSKVCYLSQKCVVIIWSTDVKMD